MCGLLGAGDRFTDRPAARTAGDASGGDPVTLAGVGFHSRAGGMLPRCGSVATRFRRTGPRPYHGPATVTPPDDVPRTSPMTDTLIPDREQAASKLADLRLRTDLFIDGDFRPARDGR